MELVNTIIGTVKVSPIFPNNSSLPKLQYDDDGKLILPTWKKRTPIGYVLIQFKNKKAENHLAVTDNSLIICPMLSQDIFSTEEEAIEMLERFKI